MTGIVLQRCTLRPWSMSDAASLATYANNLKIFDNMRDGFPFPYTPEHAEKWIRQAMEEKESVLLAVEVNGTAVGGTGIIRNNDVYRINAEIGYWLAEDYWNQGIITEAVGALVQHAFSLPEISRVYAGVFQKNRASMRVLEKNGFFLEAILRKAVIKNGVIQDEYIYAIHKS
jgi:[ribosomal protein S5]-alanine N-acetyltransferase